MPLTPCPTWPLRPEPSRQPVRSPVPARTAVGSWAPAPRTQAARESCLHHQPGFFSLCLLSLRKKRWGPALRSPAPSRGCLAPRGRRLGKPGRGALSQGSYTTYFRQLKCGCSTRSHSGICPHAEEEEKKSRTWNNGGAAIPSPQAGLWGAVDSEGAPPGSQRGVSPPPPPFRADRPSRSVSEGLGYGL